MGQYYQVVFFNNDGSPRYSVDPHVFGYGSKLSEHFQLKSEVVNAVECMLSSGGRIAWCGDYADPEPVQINGFDGEPMNLYHHVEYMDPVSKYDPTLFNAVNYDMVMETYLVNHSKKEFVYVNKNTDTGPHPLVMLTVEGNGRGGGDYHGENDYIGRWARNHICVSWEEPEGYSQLITDF